MVLRSVWRRLVFRSTFEEIVLGRLPVAASLTFCSIIMNLMSEKKKENYFISSHNANKNMH